jgi:hypothetical protein
MGVLYARSSHSVSSVAPSPRLLLPVILVSAVGVIVGSLWFWSWLWVPVFVVTGAVATAYLLPQRLLSIAAWTGSIAFALFVMHPLLRELIIWHYAKHDIYSGLAVYLLASVSAALLFRLVMKYIPSPRL